MMGRHGMSGSRWRSIRQYWRDGETEMILMKGRVERNGFIEFSNSINVFVDIARFSIIEYQEA